MNKDTLYNHYLILLNAIKENSQLSVNHLIKTTNLNLNSIGVFKEVGLLKLKKYTGSDLWTYSIRELNRIELMELICKKIDKKIIYVFDNDSNIIDCHYKVKFLTDFYGGTKGTVQTQLSNGLIRKSEVYFNYDKDFKIEKSNLRPEPKKKIVKINSKYRYDKNKVDALRTNKRILLSSVSDIANYFNTTLATLANWRKKHTEFNDLMELRDYELRKIKALDKLKESKKQKAIKHSSIVGYDKGWSNHKVAQYVAENNSPRTAKRLPGKLGVEGMKAKLKNK